MSEKTKIEKKLIVSIALIITIGIASVIPLTFYMGSTSVSAQTIIAESLFNIDIPCAYYNANATYNVEINNVIGDHGFSSGTYAIWYRDRAVIAVQPSINYAVLDDTTVARIEFFEYTIYADTLELQKAYSYFAFNNSAFNSYNNGRYANFASTYYLDHIQPTNENRGDSFFGDSITDPAEPMPVCMVGNGFNHGFRQSKDLDETYRNILAAVEAAQIIYLDVRRVAYVSLSVDGAMIVVEDNKLLQHLELTKNNDGFMFGNPANVETHVHFGLPDIPFKGSDVPEKFWPEIFKD